MVARDQRYRLLVSINPVNGTLSANFELKMIDSIVIMQSHRIPLSLGLTFAFLLVHVGNDFDVSRRDLCFINAFFLESVCTVHLAGLG